MCSISGFTASKPLSHETALRLCRALLFFGQDRGKQSAGAFVNGTLLKRAITPDEFGVLPQFAALFQGGASYALLHTRAPTCGERGDAQAQPFLSANGIVTIHNGIVGSPDKVAEEHGLSWPSGVDSELFTAFAEKYGIFKLPRFLRSVFGSSAVAVYHEKKVYLLRDGNPIETYRVDLTNGTRVMLFASTQGIIDRAAHYVWLMDYAIKSDTVPDKVLCRLDAQQGRVRELGRPYHQTWADGGYYSGGEFDWSRWKEENARKPEYKPPYTGEGYISYVNGVRGTWRKNRKGKHIFHAEPLPEAAKGGQPLGALPGPGALSPHLQHLSSEDNPLGDDQCTNGHGEVQLP